MTATPSARRKSRRFVRRTEMLYKPCSFAFAGKRGERRRGQVEKEEGGRAAVLHGRANGRTKHHGKRQQRRKGRKGGGKQSKAWPLLLLLFLLPGKNFEGKESPEKSDASLSCCCWINESGRHLAMEQSASCGGGRTVPRLLACPFSSPFPSLATDPPFPPRMMTQ